MEEKTKIGQQDNPLPLWIKLIWGIFIIWGLIYLAIYWRPDFSHWLKTTNPDTTQWQDYRR
ncbi:MAG: hypothetical protein HY578_06330 [Nitrospinae bacterium]|jgi:hypothetical protein|nr:hypothetical protein [Nitrospinota bacterium]